AASAAGRHSGWTRRAPRLLRPFLSPRTRRSRAAARHGRVRADGDRHRRPRQSLRHPVPPREESKARADAHRQLPRLVAMKPGYWVVSITVNDQAPYQQYVAANAAVFARWGGKFIVRGGRHEVQHGVAGARQVVIEFESYETARACYASREYQEILPLLLAGSLVQQFVIVEGV